MHIYLDYLSFYFIYHNLLEFNIYTINIYSIDFWRFCAIYLKLLAIYCFYRVGIILLIPKITTRELQWVRMRFPSSSSRMTPNEKQPLQKGTWVCRRKPMSSQCCAMPKWPSSILMRMMSFSPLVAREFSPNPTPLIMFFRFRGFRFIYWFMNVYWYYG